MDSVSVSGNSMTSSNGENGESDDQCQKRKRVSRVPRRKKLTHIKDVARRSSL